MFHVERLYKMETLTHCPLCNTALNGTICLQALDHLVSGKTFNIEQCPACKLLFTNPRPGEAEIDKYYQSPDYISHTDKNTGWQNRLYQIIKQRMHKNKLKLLNKHTKETGRALLDFGCGTGEFVLAAKKKGYASVGFEPDIRARHIARKKGALVLKDINELFNGNKTNSFDVITLWHVLEHLHGLQEVMKTFYSLLKPDALLVLAVPMANSADAAFYKEQWAAFDLPRHLYHFTPSTIEHLCYTSGFQISHRKGLAYDSFYISLLSEKHRNSKIAPIGAVLRGLFSNTKALLKTRPWSSEIFVCKKMNQA